MIRNYKINNCKDQLLGLLVVVLFLGTLWPILMGLVQVWRGEDYSHGFFVLPVAIYLIWRRNNGRRYPISDLNYFGFFGIILGIFLSKVGLLSGITTLANISFVGTIWAIFLFLYGFQFIEANKWELLMLIFMIPIPSRLYAVITNPLQLIATRASCWFMQAIGLPVLGEGNVIVLPNVTLEIVKACSGLRSVITIFVLAYMLSCFGDKNIWQKIILLAVAIPIALLVNVLRVVVLAVLAINDVNWFLDETGHLIFGLSLFILSLQILLLSSRVIECLSKTN